MYIHNVKRNTRPHHLHFHHPPPSLHKANLATVLKRYDGDYPVQWHHCQKEEERSMQTGIAMLHGSTKIRNQKKIIRAFYGNKLFKSNNTANCFRQQHCMLTLMGPGLPVLKRTANTPRKTTSLCSDSKIVLKAKKERNLVSTCEMM